MKTLKAYVTIGWHLECAKGTVPAELKKNTVDTHPKSVPVMVRLSPPDVTPTFGVTDVTVGVFASL